MTYYSYDRFKNDVTVLAELCCAYDAEAVVGVARGGVTFAHALSMALDIRNLQTIRTESYDDSVQRDTIIISGALELTGIKRVLIADDIVDSGKTLSALLPYLARSYPDVEFKTISLFYKPDALVQPDFTLYEATDWIDFFWERDFLTPVSL